MQSATSWTQPTSSCVCVRGGAHLLCGFGVYFTTDEIRADGAFKCVQHCFQRSLYPRVWSPICLPLACAAFLLHTMPTMTQ